MHKLRPWELIVGSVLVVTGQYGLTLLFLIIITLRRIFHEIKKIG